MKFAEDHIEARYKITGYEAHGIKINGRLFEKNLVLSPMDLMTDWAPRHFSAFNAEHLDAIYALKPEVILLGTGKSQHFPEAEVLRRLAAEQVGFEVMSTQAACRTFNIIMSEGRNVVAGFFID